MHKWQIVKSKVHSIIVNYQVPTSNNNFHFFHFIIKFSLSLCCWWCCLFRVALGWQCNYVYGWDFEDSLVSCVSTLSGWNFFSYAMSNAYTLNFKFKFSRHCVQIFFVLSFNSFHLFIYFLRKFHLHFTSVHEFWDSPKIANVQRTDQHTHTHFALLCHWSIFYDDQHKTAL